MTVAVVLAVLGRPRLWRVALVQARRLAPRRWWTRAPFLPLPDRAWLRFRMETQYGDAGARPDVEDVVTWLEWCRDFGSGTHPNRPPRR